MQLRCFLEEQQDDNSDLGLQQQPQFWQTLGASKVASHGGQKLCGALCCSGAAALQDRARDLAGGHGQAHASPPRGES